MRVERSKTDERYGSERSEILKRRWEEGECESNVRKGELD